MILIQIEKEVTDLMTKALKFCDTETANIRQPMCQYRAATVHHRLASLYHNSYRNQVCLPHSASNVNGKENP